MVILGSIKLWINATCALSNFFLYLRYNVSITPTNFSSIRMITKKQKEVLDFVKNYRVKHEYAPSLEEIKRKFKLASVSTAHYYVAKLQEAGQLRKEFNQPRSIAIVEERSMVRIPLLGTIAAGQPIEAIQEKEYIAVPRNKLPRTADIYALRVVGESMIEENISDGDIVLVKQQAVAENGQKVVALIDNHEATLKKYYKERGRVRLQPANKQVCFSAGRLRNKNFEPIIIKRQRHLLIQGVVIDVIKNRQMIFSSKQTNEREDEVGKKKIGDFLGRVTEGDCLEVMRDIPSKSINMILCDLPYGTTQNAWDSLIPLDQLWKHYERIIKEDGVIALTGQGLFSAKLVLSNPKLFKYKIVWVKSKPTNFLNAKKQPLRKHEDILIFYGRQPSYNPQMSKGEPYNKGFRKDQLTGSYGDFKTVEVKSDGERYPTDIVYFKTAESEGPVYHPTQKPVELGRYLIRTFTKPGQIVLDNTCGSGSFLVAAVLEERKFIGIEKNQEVYLFKKKKVDYIQLCNQRIEEALEQCRTEKAQVRLFQMPL